MSPRNGVVARHDLSPAQLDEVVRELTDASEDFAERDGVERAVRDLVRAGLLHRHGPFVLPTRAAARFHEIAI